MARPKKDNVPISLRIDRKLLERLNEYCEYSGQTKTVAIERALMKFIDDYEQNMKKLKVTK